MFEYSTIQNSASCINKNKTTYAHLAVQIKLTSLMAEVLFALSYFI